MTRTPRCHFRPSPTFSGSAHLAAARTGGSSRNGRRPGLEALEDRICLSLPPGWSMDSGGVADMTTLGTGATGATILPTEGSYMLRLSSAGTTPTASYANSLGEPGTAGTIVRGPTTHLLAGTAVSLDYYVSTTDAAPFNDFTLGLVSGAGGLFSFTQTGSTIHETGWQPASLTIPSDGDYQLVLVASDQGDLSLDTDLYIDNVTGFYLPDSDGTFIPPPTVSFDLAASDLTASEALAADDTATFVVTRSGDLSAPLTVHYSVFPGYPYGATAGVDYAALPGTVTFGAGESTAPIVISPIDDVLGEYDESVQVWLEYAYDQNFNPLYQLAYPGFAQATILDDDGGITTVALGVTTPTVLEGSGGAATMTLTRTGGNINAPLTVSYDVYSNYDSATPGQDYVALPGVATFAAGSSTAAINIVPIDDTLDEPTETVYVALRGPATTALMFLIGRRASARSASTMTTGRPA